MFDRKRINTAFEEFRKNNISTTEFIDLVINYFDFSEDLELILECFEYLEQVPIKGNKI